LNKQQKQKIVQYLNEAHGAELGLVRQLQSQIAMTPRGSYRDGLETHLQETRRHAKRLEGRLGDLGQRSNPVQIGLGAVQSVIGQALALTKTPLDLVRGSGGEEKVLKNAKDSCAAEALEMGTYTALARLARAAGDSKTERLATSVLAEERRMLDRLLKEIPRLTDAVARAEFDGEGSYDVSRTGAADTVREAGGTAKRTARRGAGQAKRTTRRGAGQAKRTARQTRKVPGVARAEGTVKGAVASESDLAIPNYDSLSADEVQDKLTQLSQIDLAKVNAYERRNQNRSTVTSRIDSLQAAEPWPGYDELGVDEIRAVLSEADEQRTKDVRAYERQHKDRTGVLEATERELSNA
jgi:ferritin-like metal-binding protein YciE